MGNHFVEAQLGSLSGNVSEDTTGDNLGDTPIGNVILSLLDSNGDPVTDDAGQPVTTTTNEFGNYQFTDLTPADYTVVQTQPAGLGNVSEDEGGVDDDHGDDGVLNSIKATVSPGENDLGNHFVENTPAASLGGRIWDDADRNGVEGEFESGVDGVTINLIGGGVDGDISTPEDNTIQTIITDSNGEYQFTGLTPGIEYQVSLDTAGFPAEYSDGLTTQDTGSNDEIDSDADINTGFTPIITLSPGESITDIDAGLLQPQDKLVEGTASPDTIVGTSENETIAGYKGQDTLTGGDGDDLFLFNETSDGVDLITDFTSGEDQIVLTQILEDELGYTGNDAIADGHVVIADYGSAGTMVQIDFDGTSGLLPKDVALLDGVSNLDADVNNDFDPNTDLAF